MDDHTSRAVRMTTGYFGKLPTQGDFVSRGLDHGAVSELDDWLRQCMRESQKALGRKWLDQFLISPVWRGVASRGVLQTDPVMMVMIPSVDRVGRYFPLILAASFRGHDHDLLKLPEHGKDWYDWAEHIALSILEPGFTRDQLDDALQTGEFEVAQDAASLPVVDGQQGATLWWTQASSKNPQMFESMPNATTYHETLMVKPNLPSPKSVEAIPEEPPQQPTRTLLDVHHGYAALKGTRSTQLTDAVAIGPGGQAMTVVSGLGSHPGLSGVVADVADTMRTIENPFSMSDLIAEAKGKLGTANAKMRARGQPTDTTFATSFATLLIQGDRFCVIWSGNTRVYSIRAKKMRLLTRDHVERAMPNMLTKALGASQQPNFEIMHGDVEVADRFIVCSASLVASISERQLGRMLLNADTPQQAAEHLTQDAVIGGSPLDVAAITVLVSEKSGL